MSLLLMPKKKPEPDPEPEKLRNRVGIKNVVYAALPKGTKVTLDEAIAILRAGW